VSLENWKNLSNVWLKACSHGAGDLQDVVEGSDFVLEVRGVEAQFLLVFHSVEFEAERLEV